VIQARTGSQRLPQKVLRDLGGRSVLGWVVRAARAARQVSTVVVATTSEAADDAVCTVADALGVAVVRGSADDVLARFCRTVEQHPADAVVRLTADCPLLDPTLIDQATAVWLADPTLDYVSTTLIRTLPRGLDVEVVRTSTLLGLESSARAHHRSHVTSALYEPGSRYRTMGLCVSPSADDLRITLDTADDARVLDALVAHLGDRLIPWREQVDFLRAHPDVVAANSHVRQRPLEAG